MIVFVTKEWPKEKYAEKDGRRSCSSVAEAYLFSSRAWVGRLTDLDSLDLD